VKPLRWVARFFPDAERSRGKHWHLSPCYRRAGETPLGCQCFHCVLTTRGGAGGIIMPWDSDGGLSDSDLNIMQRRVSFVFELSGRRCAGCGTFLRQDNGGTMCAPCREKEFWAAWHRSHRAGEYFVQPITPQTIAKFWALCRNGAARNCWGWRGPKNRSGLPVFSSGGTIYQARRVSFAIHWRELPQGQFVISQCRKKICCNPKHLGVALSSRKINGKHRLA